MISKPKNVKADRAKSLLETNRRNIAKKLRAGETLNGYEIKLLEREVAGSNSVAGLPEFVRNQTELADLLGTTRQTLHNHRNTPGAPKSRADGRLPVYEWKAFLEARGSIESDDPGKAALEAEQLLLKNKRLKNRIAIEQKEWMPKVVAKQVFTQLVTEAKARSFNSIIRLVTLARVAPDSNTAAAEVRKEVEQVWRSLENSEWYQPLPTQNGKEQT